MLRARIVDLAENVGPVGADIKRDERLLRWVGRELNNLRISYCEAHNLSMDDFADHVGVTKKHLYALFRAEASPGIDTLNQILVSCDSDLILFFHRLKTYERILSVREETDKDYRTLEKLAAALSLDRARPIVEGASAAVSVFLDLEDVQ